jgi:hypothetical protein
VIVCVEVQLVDAPGGSGPDPQGVIVPCLSSEIENGPESVDDPEFVTTYVYVITCPTALYVVGLALFASESPGLRLWNVQVTFSPSARLIVTVDPLALCVPPSGVGNSRCS